MKKIFLPLLLSCIVSFSYSSEEAGINPYTYDGYESGGEYAAEILPFDALEKMSVKEINGRDENGYVRFVTSFLAYYPTVEDISRNPEKANLNRQQGYTLLRREGLDINAVSSKFQRGKTLLMFCCEEIDREEKVIESHLELLKAALDIHRDTIDVNARDYRGISVIELAAVNDLPQCVQHLLKHPQIDLTPRAVDKEQEGDPSGVFDLILAPRISMCGLSYPSARTAKLFLNHLDLGESLDQATERLEEFMVNKEYAESERTQNLLENVLFSKRLEKLERRMERLESQQ